MSLFDAKTVIKFVGMRAAPAALLVYAFVAPGQPGLDDKIDYQQQVEPIFKARCSPCHIKGQASGGLALDSFDLLSKGGDSGAMYVPGRAEESELLNRILGRGGMPRMPMGFKALSDSETSLIRDWINQGARRSTGTAAKHWAFLAPVKSKPPKVRLADWPRNPIDNFILSRMETEGFEPSRPTDKITLLRRVTLDLTGLPPTPDEIDSFISDRSANAYESVVDRLLKSPHFGERMALPWLDAARYADSNGFQQDGDTHQYVWRDWVVDAFNRDMPFDRFTIEQLAGDLLPNPTLNQMVATGFNRNHMLNGEGGAIVEEQRNIALFDRVDATSTTWLGLTMACARCHDHKYDPITQRDYYAMLAYFNQVPETGVPGGSGQYRIADPAVFAGTPDQMKERRRLQDLVIQLVDSRRRLLAGRSFANAFQKWKADQALLVSEAKAANVRFSNWRDAGVYMGEAPAVAATTKHPPEAAIPVDAKERADLIDGQVYALEGENTTFYFSRSITADRPASLLFSVGSDDSVELFLNKASILIYKGARGAVPDSHLVKVQIPAGKSSLLIKVMNGGGVGGFYFKPFPGQLKDDLAGILGSGKEEHLSILRNAFAASADVPELRDIDARMMQANQSLAELDAVLPRVMVMSDAMPRKTHILNRGNYEEPLQEVSPAAPEMLGGKGGPNRLTLAKWMTSPQNPLTARVEVNRVWQMIFGAGLVATPENFGVQGEPPTNQPLLDWLAVDFRESGWKVKRLVRMIVTSSTYRQSSKVSRELAERDPQNRLFARGPRFRLPSMILRDIALASSGLLDPKLGGKPVYPYQPAGIWDGLTITLERDFTYPQSKGAENHRRSIYTFWRRTVGPGNMFDASSRQVCTVRTSLTSTPLHALTMLNDVTWVEAGRALAQTVMKLDGPEARLSEAFRRVCSRRPSPDELAILVRALNRSLASFRTDTEAAKAYLSQGEAGAMTREDPAEAAAYSSACLAIYNLDEAMTKE